MSKPDDTRKCSNRKTSYVCTFCWGETLLINTISEQLKSHFYERYLRTIRHKFGDVRMSYLGASQAQTSWKMASTLLQSEGLKSKVNGMKFLILVFII